MRAWYALIEWADTLGHRLHLPRWMQAPICDAFDRSLTPKDSPRYEPLDNGVRTSATTLKLQGWIRRGEEQPK